MEMNTAAKQTVEYLTLEQGWLLSLMINRPDITELHRNPGAWVFTIDGQAQDCVPQGDITELSDADLIEPTITSDSAYVVWRPTAAAAELNPTPFYRTPWPATAEPEPFTYALPGLAAELITPDTSHLERIATALEDIAAGVLAIDAKLQRFIADVDGKDPWVSDDMAGHHE